MARRLRTFIAVDLGKPLRDRLVALPERLTRRAGVGADEAGEVARRRVGGARGAGDEQPPDAEGAGVRGAEPRQAAEGVHEAAQGGAGRGGITATRLAATRRGARLTSPE